MRPLVLRQAIAFSLLLLPAPSWSAPEGDVAPKAIPSIALRTGEHPAFDRVVFDAPKGTTYKVSRDGELVTVSFSIAAKTQLASKALPRVSAFSVAKGLDGQEPLSVQFRVPVSAQLKDFFSGSSIVVDVMASAPAPQAAALPPAAPTPPAPKEAEKTPAKEPEKPITPPQPEQPVPVVQPSAANEPPKEAKEEVKSASLQQDKPKLDTIAPAPKAAPLPEVEKAPPLPEQKAPVFHTQIPSIEQDTKAVELFNRILSEPERKPVAVFDPKMPIGAAIFERGGYITILFDRKLGEAALASSPPPRVKVEPINMPRNTGYRIAVPSGVGVQATRQGTAWEVYLVRTVVETNLSTEFVVQPEFALGARLLVSTGQTTAPIYYPDPVVGDDLIVQPLFETGGFTIRRRLMDFQVVPAAQGLVIKPMHERVIARMVPDGIEITAEGGLKLSPTYDTGKMAEYSKNVGKVLYDFMSWRGRANETFSQTRQKLMEAITEVTENERILARLDLARFYFANGNGREALALLKALAKTIPEIETHPDYLAVRGGANILSGRYLDGMTDLSHPSLRDQLEATLWKGAASAYLRQWPQAFEQFNMSFSLLHHYPEPFRSDFAVLAVETALTAGKDSKAVEWLDMLEKTGYRASSEPAIRYLRGVLYSKAGRAEQAERLWRQVAKESDRLYKTRAELALIDLGVATRSLTSKQAAQKLEGLRFAWRGDDLELDILRRLGGFYLDAKNFSAGFKILTQAMRLFPDTPLSATLKAELTQTFHDVFMTEAGANLSPVEALSLFADYKMLIPEGEKGNDVRLNLIERLIDVDLLDPAVGLLEDFLKNSKSPEEKVKTSTRLAGVHLLDGHAQEAIKSLDQTEGEADKLSQAVKEERQLLRARALSELGKHDEAEAALPANDDKATMLLRADIALRAQKWDSASKAFMDLVGDPEPGKKISDEKADWLVRAAMAMAKSSNTSGLDALAVDYGAEMDKTTKAALFRILTRPESAAQIKDIRAAQSHLSEVDLFRSVLDGYRKQNKAEEKK